jgi:hypothetical protein
MITRHLCVLAGPALTVMIGPLRDPDGGRRAYMITEVSRGQGRRGYGTEPPMTRSQSKVPTRRGALVTLR